jgi:hypothetical protein
LVLLNFYANKEHNVQQIVIRQDAPIFSADFGGANSDFLACFWGGSKIMGRNELNLLNQNRLCAKNNQEKTG